MIVYQHRDFAISPPAVLARLLQDAEIVSRLARPGHDEIIDLLIRFGDVESAVIDAICPECDDDIPLAADCRHAAVEIAAAAVASANEWNEQIAPALSSFAHALAAIDRRMLPAQARARAPEGFASYAVYPETYADAAMHFWADERPHRVVCLGVRSIGTTLSAVAAAALRARGSTVRSFTVRPHGHPFDRQLRLTTRLERTFAEETHAFFAVVDEGPGLSGSTLTSVAARLRVLGVPMERIVLFTSRQIEVGALRSPAARSAWPLHRKYTQALESRPRVAWLERATDVSAGQWRSCLMAADADLPAVHPQHERRKYLLNGRTRLLRFAGLGPYGREVWRRAQQLAAAGFTPEAIGLSNGFLGLRFVRGRPLNAADVDEPLLDRMGHYVAYLRTFCEAGDPSPAEPLMAMLDYNVGEGLGERWRQRLAAAMPVITRYVPDAAVAIDGRMLPHEWLVTDSGFVKTDAFDHHRDDFFPGVTDIAWDLAGATVEFNLTAAAERRLLEAYGRRANDRTLPARLPFFTLAYLAYRLGYAVMAAETLASTPEGPRFRALAHRYRARLRRQIARLPMLPSARRSPRSREAPVKSLR